jgi:outer membrane immunogenic protein
MKKFLLTTAAFGMLALPAMAADMAPAPAPVYRAPIPVPVCLWCGFYIGGDIGGFGAEQSATTNAFPSGFGAPAIPGAGFPGIGILPTAHSLNSSGFLGGVHAGYNWQITPSWLIGAEGDVMFGKRNVSSAQTTFDTFAGARPDGTMVISNGSSSNYLASLRGRFGWIGGPWMVYATGGAAWTNLSTNASWAEIPGALVPAPTPSTLSFGGTQTGYVVGGGLEWMLSPNWLIRAEYLHYGFQGASGAGLPFVVPPGNECTPVGTCGWNVSTSNLKIDTGRVGLSYKF